MKSYLFEMDLNTISIEKVNMAGYEASIAVWIPLIVGLAPVSYTHLTLPTTPYV